MNASRVVMDGPRNLDVTAVRAIADLVAASTAVTPKQALAIVEFGVVAETVLAKGLHPDAAGMLARQVRSYGANVRVDGSAPTVSSQANGFDLADARPWQDNRPAPPPTPSIPLQMHQGPRRVKIVSISRGSIWQPGYQERKFTRTVQAMERKGWRYVETQTDWSGLKVVFERGD